MTSPPLGTCKWYVSIDQPECGLVATHKVKVKTRVTQAMVDLCDRHNSIHDETFARIRAERKSGNSTPTV